MTWVDFDVGWKRLEQMLKRMDECPMVTAREVCTTYAHAEETIAREERVLFFAVQTDATR